MASIKETIHTFTPKGRYEQYRAKYDYLLDQAQGEARYGLEKKIDHDAKAYARNAVALEVLGTAAVVTGGYVLGREMYRGKIKDDIKAIENAIHSIPDKINEAKLRLFIGWNVLMKQSGEQFGEGLGVGVTKSVLDSIPKDTMTILEKDAGILGNSFASGVAMGLEKELNLAADIGKKQAELGTVNAKLKVIDLLTKVIGGKDKSK